MFTGLVLDVGVVEAVSPQQAAVHLRLRTRLGEQLSEGDSLAVNGVCLTVTTRGADWAVATAIPETLSRTNLGYLRPGSRVNLEPALRASDRLAGHIVQGHVDGLGQVAAVEQRGLSWELRIAAAPEHLRYVVEKGSIAVDGTSLTVAKVATRDFTLAIIPHTLGETTLRDRRAGDRVNLEVDILAKYVERMLHGVRGSNEEPGQQGVSEALLRRYGFA